MDLGCFMVYVYTWYVHTPPDGVWGHLVSQRDPLLYHFGVEVYHFGPHFGPQIHGFLVDLVSQQEI
jgi:hypothetical protein